MVPKNHETYVTFRAGVVGRRPTFFAEVRRRLLLHELLDGVADGGQVWVLGTARMHRDERRVHRFEFSQEGFEGLRWPGETCPAGRRRAGFPRACRIYRRWPLGRVARLDFVAGPAGYLGSVDIYLSARRVAARWIMAA
jgi:hypothetical protein